MSDFKSNIDWPKPSQNLPTREGPAQGKSFENRAIANVSGQEGTRSKFIDNVDGSQTRLKTRHGFPEFVTTPAKKENIPTIPPRTFVFSVLGTIVAVIGNKFETGIKIIQTGLAVAKACYNVAKYKTDLDHPQWFDVWRLDVNAADTKRELLVNNRKLLALADTIQKYDRSILPYCEGAGEALVLAYYSNARKGVSIVNSSGVETSNVSMGRSNTFRQSSGVAVSSMGDIRFMLGYAYAPSPLEKVTTVITNWEKRNVVSSSVSLTGGIDFTENIRDFIYQVPAPTGTIWEPPEVAPEVPLPIIGGFYLKGLMRPSTNPGYTIVGESLDHSRPVYLDKINSGAVSMPSYTELDVAYSYHNYTSNDLVLNTEISRIGYSDRANYRGCWAYATSPSWLVGRTVNLVTTGAFGGKAGYGEVSEVTTKITLTPSIFGVDFRDKLFNLECYLKHTIVEKNYTAVIDIAYKPETDPSSAFPGTEYTDAYAPTAAAAKASLYTFVIYDGFTTQYYYIPKTESWTENFVLKTKDYIFADIDEDIYVYLDAEFTMARIYDATVPAAPALREGTASVKLKHVIDVRGEKTEIDIDTFEITPMPSFSWSPSSTTDSGNGLYIGDYGVQSYPGYRPTPVFNPRYTSQGNCPFIAYTTKAEELNDATPEIYVDFKVLYQMTDRGTGDDTDTETGLIRMEALQATWFIAEHVATANKTALWTTLFPPAAPYRIQFCNGVVGPWQTQLGAGFEGDPQMEITRI